MQPSKDLSRLVEIMARLRDPETGCPWDLEQDFASIRHYTIEEAYEVADAIERKDYDDLCEELGDLILQPVYHAQLAAEQDLFDIGDVIFAITQKLVRRHPHVFGDQAARDAGMAKGRWDDVKAEERAAKAARKGRTETASVLDDVPLPLPALVRAEKLDKRAAKVGFDWPDAKAVLEKCREELNEVEEALSESEPAGAVAEEVGDLLFAIASLSRHIGVDPEAALRDANIKFTRRFHYVEKRCAEDGVDITDAGMERLDGYWNEIRVRDKSDGVDGT